MAVKQIKLVDVPKSELRMIEVSWSSNCNQETCDTDNMQAEIDLLKNLHVSEETPRRLQAREVGMSRKR